MINGKASVLIDATNISSGGGLTHLKELLGGVGKGQCDFVVTIVGQTATLAQLPEREWLEKTGGRLLDGNVLSRMIWKSLFLRSLAKKVGADVLFSPGAGFSYGIHPFVSMSQNMLPFEKCERDRFRFSSTWVRYLLLRVTQGCSFAFADGIVFLTAYARDVVGRSISFKGKSIAIVPHGISEKFGLSRHHSHGRETFEWLYVSIVNLYKHQDKLVFAAQKLREKGYDFRIKLVGPANPVALKNFERSMEGFPGVGDYIEYVGPVSHDNLVDLYAESDAFVFPSSCENMPNILLEAMASGLPIASSNRGPMPEVVGEDGTFFDPENAEDIAGAMQRMMDDHEMREVLSLKARANASKYSWSRCADETFEFLLTVALSGQSRRKTQ